MRRFAWLAPILLVTGCPPSTPDTASSPAPTEVAATGQAGAVSSPATDDDPIEPAAAEPAAAEPAAAEQLPELRYYAFDG